MFVVAVGVVILRLGRVDGAFREIVTRNGDNILNALPNSVTICDIVTKISDNIIKSLPNLVTIWDPMNINWGP